MLAIRSVSSNIRFQNKEWQWASTDLTESIELTQAAQARVEHFAQAFADEVIGEHRNEDGETGKDREPPGESRAAGFV